MPFMFIHPLFHSTLCATSIITSLDTQYWIPECMWQLVIWDSTNMYHCIWDPRLSNKNLTLDEALRIQQEPDIVWDPTSDKNLPPCKAPNIQQEPAFMWGTQHPIRTCLCMGCPTSNEILTSHETSNIQQDPSISHKRSNIQQATGAFM